MSYFFTKVPTQWSPSELYQVKEGIYLKPATRTAYADYPGAGATIFLDTMFFITSSATKEDHITKLRYWLLYHAVILDDHHICHFFESGLLQKHSQVNTLEEIQETGDDNAYALDYDDIAKQIYWLHIPPTPMSYKSLFLKYERLAEEQRSLITAFLLTIETTRSYNIQYSLFHNIRKYWQVVDYAAILEAIIGHAPNCPGSATACSVCNKKLQPHRKGSEKQWRDDFLSGLGIDQETQNEYLAVITTAYDDIRNKTAHPSRLPTPQYPMIVDTQVYDVERSRQDFSTDTYALDSIILNIRDIARYLLLNHVFDLNFFPRLHPMKATHIGE